MEFYWYFKCFAVRDNTSYVFNLDDWERHVHSDAACPCPAKVLWEELSHACNAGVDSRGVGGKVALDDLSCLSSLTD